jgi:hypothetical protein
MKHAETFGVHLAGLPEIASEDLKAIRGVLPGKLLGRAAALLSLALSLALTYLEYFGPIHGITAVGEKLGLTSHSWYQDGVVFGLPFLTIAAQSFNEWRARSAERTLKALATRDAADQSGYFRIGPYLDTAEDRKSFDRADRAHERVLDWLQESAGVPLYLTGDSGSGKSSLLNAFVLPSLRETGWTVIEARAWQDPAAAVRNTLMQTLSLRRSRVSESDLASVIRAATRRASAGLLLVLDQFEEFVILGKPEQQRQFADLIADLSRAPIEGLRLLLVLRSDYQVFLEDIGLPLPRNDENLYQVARFTLRAAASFMKRSGLELQPNELDHLLTSAAELDDTPGLVRPITLNVIGYVLAANRGAAPSLDAGQLVRRYIEQTVEQPALRDLAPRILELLITEQSTKQPRSEGELSTATGMRRGEVRAVLNGLGCAALARPLDAGQGVWELSHDFVARAVARYLGRGRRDVARCIRYAAPVLFTIMLTTAASVIAWHYFSHEAEWRLAELGLSIMPRPDNYLYVESNPRLTSKTFAAAVPFLDQLSGRIRSVVVYRGQHNSLVEDLEPLKGLTALQYLVLKGTRAANIGSLKGLTELQALDLSSTNVEDLSPLGSLKALRWLLLPETKIKDLSPLKGLTSLHALNLAGTEVVALEPLKDLAALQWLNLSGTKVHDLKPLKGLTALQLLDLSGTNPESLEPLRALSALRKVYLPDLQTIDLSPLQDLHELAVIVDNERDSVSAAEEDRFARYRQDRRLSRVEFKSKADDMAGDTGFSLREPVTE